MRQDINAARDALTFAAGAAGFAFVDVRPRYTPNPAKRTVDVTFDVKEGPRVYIDRIVPLTPEQAVDKGIERLTTRPGQSENAGERPWH